VIHPLSHVFAHRASSIEKETGGLLPLIRRACSEAAPAEVLLQHREGKHLTKFQWHAVMHRIGSGIPNSLTVVTTSCRDPDIISIGGSGVSSSNPLLFNNSTT